MKWRVVMYVAVNHEKRRNMSMCILNNIRLLGAKASGRLNQVKTWNIIRDMRKFHRLTYSCEALFRFS